jgi:branched-chain amino acid transport system ATP-binding protein
MKIKSKVNLGLTRDPKLPVVETRGLSAGYGAQAVISDINLVLHPGEVVGLFGANGAGKTTTMLALAGELMPMTGEVELHGEVTRDPLYRRAQNGLMFVTEEKSVIMGLTTRDNLRVGGVDIDIALGLFPELEKRINIMGGLLSGGEQQMLSLARALGRNPRILLADELSLGLAPIVVQRLLQAVRDAAAELGMAVLLVEQHVRQALKFADRAYIMRRGTVEISGTTAELMSRISDIEETYLTSSH